MKVVSRSACSLMRGMLNDKAKLAAKYLAFKTYKRCVYEMAKLVAGQFGSESYWVDQQMLMAWALYQWRQENNVKSDDDNTIMEWIKLFRREVLEKAIEYLKER